jgi:hypothetical protein
MTPEEQSALFIETARKLGVDESGEEFERAFASVVRPGRGEPYTKSVFDHEGRKSKK